MINPQPNQLKKAHSIIRALNHKLRRQILELLDENKELTVTSLLQKMSLVQSVTSQHLAILRRANIVETRRQGKEVYYRINYDMLDKVYIFVNNLLS